MYILYPYFGKNKPHMKPQLSIILLMLFFSAFFNSINAQNNANEGNALVSNIGKGPDNDQVKELIKTYQLDMANNQHYLSTQGVELILKKELLNEIHLYQNSAVYGSYKGTLPGKLKFGMSESEIKQLLGKPALAYNSGYLEYQYDTYVLSCWFEGGKLNQVVIAAKE
jgi:hypothetical protein